MDKRFYICVSGPFLILIKDHIFMLAVMKGNKSINIKAKHPENPTMSEAVKAFFLPMVAY